MDKLTRRVLNVADGAYPDNLIQQWAAYLEDPRRGAVERYASGGGVQDRRGQAHRVFRDVEDIGGRGGPRDGRGRRARREEVVNGFRAIASRPTCRYPVESPAGLVKKLERHQALKEAKFQSHAGTCRACAFWNLATFGRRLKRIGPWRVRWYCREAHRISDSAGRAADIATKLEERMEG